MKGNRDMTFGYRPHIARSKNGFVGAMLVDKGNPSDQSMLEEGVKQWMAQTNVVPYLVSVDDGFTSKEGRWNVKGWGVNHVSFSGGTGKQITDQDTWKSEEHQNARRNRAAVESTVFTMKNGYEFGRMSRCGIESVRAEMLEDVLAHNFMRMAQIKRSRSSPKKKAA